MARKVRWSQKQAGDGKPLVCPRCGNQSAPYSTHCWMCGFQFVDDETLDRLRRDEVNYRKNTPLRQRRAELKEYYRSIGATRTDLIFDGFCSLSIIIGIVGGLLYLLLHVL